MFKLVKSENKPLTRELALAFKAMAPSPTEREIADGRVRHLKEKVDAGLAIPFNWAKVLHKGNGHAEMRMNGQHSSTMLTSYDEASFPSNLTVHLDSYEVDTDEDLALLSKAIPNSLKRIIAHASPPSNCGNLSAEGDTGDGQREFRFRLQHAITLQQPALRSEG